jgi:hypothetical protein
VLRESPLAPCRLGPASESERFRPDMGDREKREDLFPAAAVLWGYAGSVREREEIHVKVTGAQSRHRANKFIHRLTKTSISLPAISTAKWRLENLINYWDLPVYFVIRKECGDYRGKENEGYGKKRKNKGVCKVM